MIPDFQTLMLPLLQLLSDGKEHSLRETITTLSDQFNLSEDERSELLPSGNQAIIDNRVGWARTYLKKAQLIDNPRRGIMVINDSGRKLLETAPKKINIKLLRGMQKFQEWQESYSSTENTNSTNDITDVETDKTPQELLEYSYQKLKSELASELLDKVKNCTPAFFEKLVVQLLISMGYGGSRKEAGEILGKSHDGGIDGVIKEDKLGLDTIYIQAKKYDSTVPIAHVRDFAGALLGKQARKGVFISTGDYPASAKDFVNNIDRKIVLIDGKLLATLMIENNIGVTPVERYEIKELNTDYFDEA